MTIRKTSYGAEFSPPPTTPTFLKPNTQQSSPNPEEHLNVDSADIPPPPAFSNRTPHGRNESFDDPGNPWVESHNFNVAVSDGTSPSAPVNHKQDGAQPTTNFVNVHTPSSSGSDIGHDGFWGQIHGEGDQMRTPNELRTFNANSTPQQPTVFPGTLNETEDLSTDFRSSPGSNAIKRKPVAATTQLDTTGLVVSDPVPVSTNPFRRRISTEQGLPMHSITPSTEPGENLFANKGKLPVRESSLAFQSPIMQDFDKIPAQPTSLPPPPPSFAFDPPTWPQPSFPMTTESGQHDSAWMTEAISPPGHFLSHPDDQPVPPELAAPASKQETGIVQLNDEPDWPSPTNESQYSQKHEGDLIDFGDDFGANAGLAGAVNNDVPPTKPPRPTDLASSTTPHYEDLPPTKPPRPATVVTQIDSDAEVARMVEQRNETYQIKHFNWFDQKSSKLRQSSILIQNQNGPCPLLALVNALILGVPETSQAALDEALRAREQVSLGLIIETLMDELLSSNNEELPDVDDLNRFLSRLHSGMTANPRFIEGEDPNTNLMDARNSTLHLPQSEKGQRRPGNFEATQDMKLYGSFSIPLVHGWLPSKGDPAWKAFAQSAQTYEDAQVLQFGEEELEFKLSNNGLTEEEEQIWRNITAIKDFLRLYPTQLTPEGLVIIREWLLPGQFAILFRNDHFSTIYKNPSTGELYTLITDAGYADRDEIVWEALADHSGSGEFFSGDFMSVSHSNAPAASRSIDPSGPRSSSQFSAVNDSTAPLSPQEQQEQHDADFAMALQLQEEEQQRVDRNRRRTGSNRQPESNIPITLRPRPPPEARPTIPPRTSRADVAVNRSAALTEDDAPPAYEEAAKGRPYVPPLGSPHHPSADPSPRASTSTLSQVASAPIPITGPPHQPPPGAAPPNVLRRPQRRTSAYGENNSQYSGTRVGPASPSISRPGGHAYGVGAGPGFDPDRFGSGGGGAAGAAGVSAGPGRRRGQSGLDKVDRDCVVM